MMAFFISRLLGDLHWRLVAVVMGLWLVFTDIALQLLAWLQSSITVEWFTQAVGWAGVGASLLVALILAVVAIPAQRTLWNARS